MTKKKFGEVELVTFNEDGSITCHFGIPQNRCRHSLTMAITDSLYECDECHDVIPGEIILFRSKMINSGVTPI